MTEKETLDPRRFISTLQRRPEFLAELPADRSLAELPREQRHSFLRHAIAESALSVAHELEKDRGEYDLDANLYKLIGELPSFFEHQQAINNLITTYGSALAIPPHLKQEFRHHKAVLIPFNHTLREVINAGASRFNFNELLAFMTTMHAASGGSATISEFNNLVHKTLIGMRNEIAFEQILIASGLEYQAGDIAQDASGGDFIIEGVPIDVKASSISTTINRNKAIERGGNPHLIIWSHIAPGDYNGQLSLPYSRVHVIAEEVLPDIKQALNSERAPQAV